VRLLDAEPPEALRIDVVDRGGGIEPGVRERLFERGARTRRAGDRPSHGLGLYIARRAMELQGGAVSLVATGPQGTQMRLHLREAWADDRDWTD
jgi:signal transduction histidine kinase